MEQSKGIVYLIPVPIAAGAAETLPAEVFRHTQEIKHFFVENVRTARRFLKSIHPMLVIEQIAFSEISKHEGIDFETLKKWLKEGYAVGVMSEAGCPGIADPGAEIVAKAHQLGAKVVPLTGPSSILLALMASGFSGQSFCFHGYLPLKEPVRGKKIKELEQVSQKEKQTQLFIETPYRNNAMLNDLLKHCQNHTYICIAQNITAANAFIRTQQVAEWKKNKPDLEKQPAIFLLLAG